MRTIPAAILFLSIFLGSAFAGENSLSIGDLNSSKIMGELGVPLHGVHKVKCRVVDMSFTNAKADDGRLALQIISVDDETRKGKHYIDLPELQEDKKPQPGTIYEFWAYETVQASGYPSEAFEKLKQLPVASVDLHFRSKLVVLKFLNIKRAE